MLFEDICICSKNIFEGKIVIKIKERIVVFFGEKEGDVRGLERYIIVCNRIFY